MIRKINEARKTIFKLLTHPNAPTNDKRNNGASQLLVEILRWQISDFKTQYVASPLLLYILMLSP